MCGLLRDFAENGTGCLIFGEVFRNCGVIRVTYGVNLQKRKHRSSNSSRTHSTPHTNLVTYWNSWGNKGKLLFIKFKYPLGWRQDPPRGIILRRARYKGPSSQKPSLLHDLPRRVWKSRRYRDEKAGGWMHFVLTTLRSCLLSPITRWRGPEWATSV